MELSLEVGENVWARALSDDKPVRLAVEQIGWPLTDAELRAAPVEVAGSLVVTALTDDELRASPVPVSGPLTDTQLRAAAIETKRGTSQVYNITTATVAKATAGRLCTVSVISSGSGAGAIHDCATTAAAAAANKVQSIAITDRLLTLDWPCATGIVIVPGTGQVLAVSFT